jgi:hypothetical protein
MIIYDEVLSSLSATESKVKHQKVVLWKLIDQSQCARYADDLHCGQRMEQRHMNGGGISPSHSSSFSCFQQSHLRRGNGHFVSPH